MPSETPALAAYGTLAPGNSNHKVVAGLAGTWLRAHLRGHRWVWAAGPYVGLPALVLDAEGPVAPVAVLVSGDLPRHWERLDTFEGPGYRRVLTEVVYDEPGPAAALGAPSLVSVYEAIADYDGADGVGPS